MSYEKGYGNDREIQNTVGDRCRVCLLPWNQFVHTPVNCQKHLEEKKLKEADVALDT